MPVKTNIDPELVFTHVKDAWEKGLYVLSEQILTDCNRFVKREEGTLEDSSNAASQPRKGLLIWDTPYAKRQYWEIETSRTPGRTWKWCETAKERYFDDWQRIAEKVIRNNL